MASSLGLEAGEGGDWPEDLLARDRHLRRDARDHRRLEEGAPQRMAMAADLDLRAGGDRVGQQPLDLLHGVHGDQRPLGDAGLGAVADLHGLHPRRQLPGERVVDRGVNQEAVRADAGLAHVAVLGDQRPLDGLLEIGVIEDDEGGVAAQLQ
jgi:hypothetical protein